MSQTSKIYLLGMFFRQKKNRSGVVSVQVIDKSSGKYRLAKTIGSSSDAAVVAELVKQAETWIKEHQGQFNLDFSGGRLQAEQFLEHITQIRVQGVELLVDSLFEQIGFGQIKDVLFKRLVLARLCYPASKLRTTDYFAKYDLKIRPIYYRVQRRIEAHICIAFATDKVYKELERQLKDKKLTLSPEKAIEIAKTIFSVRVTLNESDETISKTIYTRARAEQKNLADLFGF